MIRFAPINAVTGWVHARLAGGRAFVLGASIIALALGATSALVSYATSQQGVVARVNGEPITERDLQRRMLTDPAVQRQAQQRDMKRILAGATGSQQPSEPQASAAKEQVRFALRRLVFVRLLVQEAARRDIKVTDKEVDDAVRAFKARFKDDAGFAAWRKLRDLEDDRSLLEAMRAELLVTRVSAALAKEARVSDEQVQAYYEKHTAELKIPEAARLQLIRVADKAAADNVLRTLKKGADFASLARERSTGARAAQGGDIGWVNAETLPPALHKAVARLNVGETSGPVQSGSEFMVVRLVAQRPARTRSLTEVRPAIEQRLLQAKQRQIIQGWLTEQEKKSKIEIFR